jgi:O-antigen/teichoic acid export membrane protein
MKANQLKAGAALSYASMGLGYMVSIIYTPIMLRLLGQSEYGLYNLVASVVAYLGVLNFGFGSAYMRYYTKYKVKDDKERIATLNGMFLIIFSAIGFIAVIAGMTLALNTEVIFGDSLTSLELAKAKILMMILVINLAISFPNIVFSSHITANEKFVFQKLVQILKTIINPFVVLPILLLGYGSFGMVLATTILNVIIEIINVFYCIKKLKMRFSFRYFDFKLMKEMTIFSSFIFVNLLIDQINWNVDKFILGRFHGTFSVAVYGLAAQLNTYYISISSTISSVFIPRVHRLVSHSDNNCELTHLFTKIGRVQFIMLSFILSGLLFFGRPFINMWAGNNYDVSFSILLLLIIPVTIPLIQNIGIEIQRAKNMHQFRSWVYFFIALANLAVSIPLAKMYEGIGAAIGTAVTLIVGNGLIMNWYNHVKVGLDMKFFWKQILSFVPSLIGPIMVGIIISNFFNLNNLYYFLLFGIMYVIIFCISMWFIGMNHYEKDLIAKPVRKIFTKLRH